MRHAFTLIELLIVVVILAILAATVIPHFSDASRDSKDAVGLTNLRTLRAQVHFYKAQHDGRVPDAALANLLVKTDVTGAAGGEFGPYLQSIPVNPFTNKSTVTATSSNPPTAASASSNRGWLYHAGTGNVWLDEAGYLDK
jgi:prepilin-type N-terminal cleavage/methylation domain-containing protein